MSEYASLEAALEGRFDKAFAELPAEAHQHAGVRAPADGRLDARAFALMPWDSLTQPVGL